jgi:hypothetical protein
MNGSLLSGCGRGSMNGLDVVMIMIMIIMEIGVTADELTHKLTQWHGIFFEQLMIILTVKISHQRYGSLRRDVMYFGG